MTANSASYKARKEAFVSNLSGSTLTDINLVTLVAPVSVLLWTALQKRGSFFHPYTPVSCVIDTLLNVCAILFAFTIYSSAPVLLHVFVGVPAVFLLLPLRSPSSSRPKERKGRPSKTDNEKSSTTLDRNDRSIGAGLPVRPFLTHYRGTMMIATIVSILAVDFPVFPRRFAKVETWGTSLMDLGVGSFVFAAGVVSARSLLLLQQTAPSNSKKGAVTRAKELSARLARSLQHSLPLWVLGLVRLYSVKELEYAEHVTEYGVHWNFFFTLALLPPWVEISDSLTGMMPITFIRSHNFLAMGIAIVYELVLNSTGLLAYILMSPRGPGLLSKNREGVFSFVGYLAIFLSGRATGMIICSYHPRAPSSTRQSRQKNNGNSVLNLGVDEVWNERRHVVLPFLLRQALVYGGFYLVSTSVFGLNLTVSRRLANLPYVIWIVAFNNAQLFLFGVVEHLGTSFTYSVATPGTKHASAERDEIDDKATTRSADGSDREQKSESTVRFATSRVLSSFNQNGLVIFLLANLLTGAVNLSVNTLDASNAVAMGVLLAYVGAVTAVTLGMDLMGVKIKI